MVVKIDVVYTLIYNIQVLVGDPDNYRDTDSGNEYYENINKTNTLFCC